ncbi:MAG: Gfo/Idh/MocA family oxidoreductase [Phycisphaerae bacterium]|nr:Gfo/Idh/MocA family oxidoreductase [Phycisphaerae bacterium]
MTPASNKSQGPKTVTVALVGSGFSSSFHVENYKKVHGVHARIKGVTSRHRDRAEAFAAKHGLETVYADLAAAVADPDVDVVDICVPNKLHELMAVQALQAGKHVVVEKPLTAYCGPGGDDPQCGIFHEDVNEVFAKALASADRMVDAADKAGKYLMYAENWIYAPAVQKANRLLSQCDTTIFRMVGEESHSGTHSDFSKHWQHAGGGAMFNKGCHPAGAAVYLKAQEGMRRGGKPIKPVAVRAQVAQLTHIDSFKKEEPKYVKTGWVNCEDWGTMLVTFADGSVAMITAADTILGGISNSITVYASKQTIHCRMVPTDCVMAYTPDGENFGGEYIREKVETHTGWQSASPDEDWMNGFPFEFQDFCEAVAYNRPPVSDGRLGRDVVKLCYGGYVSAITGREFRLD